MRHVTRIAALLALGLTPVALAAQAAPSTDVLTVYRETVKPGKSAAHDALEAAWAKALFDTKANPMLAIKAMTGAPENWYMSLYPSWAAFESASKADAAHSARAAINDRFSAQEDAYLTDGRMLILTSRPDLSYGPPADLAASRYMSVQRIATRPGHTSEWVENRRMIKAAHEAAKLSDRFSVWQAASGAPTGTFFVFVARKSLAEADEQDAIHGPAYQAALGGADGQKKLSANSAAAVISTETNYFSFAPAQSIPVAEWITADPGYWKPKVSPKAAPKPAP